jgi:hypothetical protein
MVSLLLNGSAIVVAQDILLFDPGASSDQLSPSMVSLVGDPRGGSGGVVASDVSAPSLAGRPATGISTPQVVPSGSSPDSLLVTTGTTGTTGTRTALIVDQDENPDADAPIIFEDVRGINPNIAATDVKIVNPRLQAQLQEVPDTLNTLNPPFRACQSSDATKVTYSNFATYTIVGKADFSDLIDELKKGGEDIMLQLFVDYDTATVKGFMTVADDKLKTLHPPLTSIEGDTARQTLDEAGTVRLDISQFKPIFNTECERTVTGQGGSSFVPGDPDRLVNSQKAHLHLPFKTCELNSAGTAVPASVGNELKSAIWTIQGFNNIERSDNIGGGDTPFNMQIYNDLLTGTIKGTLFIDPPNNGVVDIADTNDEVGDKVEFSPVITGECYRQPSYNT